MTTRTCTVRSHERKIPLAQALMEERRTAVYAELQKVAAINRDNRLLWDMEQALKEESHTNMLAMMGEVQ